MRTIDLTDKDSQPFILGPVAKGVLLRKGLQDHLQIPELENLKAVFCAPRRDPLSDFDRLILRKKSVTEVTICIRSPEDTSIPETMRTTVVADSVNFIANESGIKLQDFKLYRTKHSMEVVAAVRNLLKVQEHLTTLCLVLPSFPLELVEGLCFAAHLQTLSLNWIEIEDALVLLVAEEERKALEILPQICPRIQSFSMSRTTSIRSTPVPTLDITPLFGWELKSLGLAGVPMSIKYR